MSFPKKGSRKITIDGEVFYWRVRKKMTHNEKHNDSISIPIQHKSCASILLANLGYCRAGELGGYPSNPIPNITPALIELCIRFGISNGWNHLEKGKPFHIYNLSEQLVLHTGNNGN